MGDSTRRPLGSGAGVFATFNRNKKSLALNVADPRGREVVLHLMAGADVFSENFKPGAMDALGFGVATLARLNPRLIYGSAPSARWLRCAGVTRRTPAPAEAPRCKVRCSRTTCCWWRST